LFQIFIYVQYVLQLNEYISNFWEEHMSPIFSQEFLYTSFTDDRDFALTH